MKVHVEGKEQNNYPRTAADSNNMTDTDTRFTGIGVYNREAEFLLSELTVPTGVG
jgi:hypothetical protein